MAEKSPVGWLAGVGRVSATAASSSAARPTRMKSRGVCIGEGRLEYNYGSYLRLLTPTAIKQHFQNF
jgi:hypothetical protein